MNSQTLDTNQVLFRNIGLDLLRVTEAAALAAGRWVGSGKYLDTHRAAAEAAIHALNEVEMDGHIVIGEEGRLGTLSSLNSGSHVGTGSGPPLDVVVDPIDGTKLVVSGYPGAISTIAVAPRHTIWSPHPAAYVDKIVVDREAAEALVPEVMDAPAAWTLALIARVKGKSVRDLDVVVLDRPRHADLIEEIRATGARVWLRQADAEAALLAATVGTNIDVLMGIGGAAEAILAACAVKALHGGMLARLAPQSRAERDALVEAGLERKRIWSVAEMVRGDDVFVAATGITRSDLLHEVDFHGQVAHLHSLLIRARTGTRRFVQTEQSILQEVVTANPLVG
ncbi:MAG: fructose-bisphosphatase class II [Anaerolineales bacterium]|nr:fructose-bisphosphatase class II [Anaerolineales bacterium]MCB8954485.1 fructose-bisphosphatase class II [Ardenticatenales bacterium]